MAEWAAFQLSIWHEIATWYGFASMASWPEKISSFSPEDLYSNLLGVKLAGGIVTARGVADDAEYNRSMDAWIQQALERLHALPRSGGEAAMRHVEGLWWDPEARIPDWHLVLRRNLGFGTEIRPWVVSAATDDAGERRGDFAACAGARVLVLRNPDGFEGHAFRDHMAVEFEVDDALAAEGFPFPRDSRVVTQADFAAIVAAIRAANAEAFGQPADRP